MRAAASRALLVNASELLRRPGSERDIDVSLTTAELGLADARFDADDPVGVHLRLESTNDAIVVQGSIEVPYHGVCRRCLREVDAIEVAAVDELYQTVLTDPDAFEIVGEQLDLQPMVRELAMLEAPESPLCRPDCKGLCSVCGADLNENECGCEQPAPPSPWDVLDQLKPSEN